jgi:GNAT superfamily N-acetyltransferase
VIETIAVPAARVRPMRAAILRPGQPPELLVYAGDDARETLHLVALEDGQLDEVIGIATVLRDPHPREAADGDWRVRGMATAPGRRRRGIGAALLARCEEHALAHGGRRLWCNARLPARGFYERAGWSAQGEVFELDEIGPHVVMSKPLT